MDAFSLGISLGTLDLLKKEKKELVSIIGLFHFIMPLIGYRIGNQLIQISSKNMNYLVSFIVLVLSIEMAYEKSEENKIISFTVLKIILVAVTVSIDSLAIGFVYGLKKEFFFLAVPIISISSMIFTYSGLKIGTYLSNKYQEKGKKIGIGILLLLGLKNLLFH